MPSNVGNSPSFQQAVGFLLSRVDYERSTSIPYRSRCFKLQRMEDLLALVGSPHRAVRAIHIAGTKGKGSTAAMISSILSAAGYRVGRFTSPHVESVCERISVNGVNCSEDRFAQLIGRLIPAVNEIDYQAESRGYIHGPTFFEILTAAAFLEFVDQQVDFAVLEVGLGGRLDATNVCMPVVTVITSISFDHMEQLGYTLASIAREKAGIIKPKIPVVSGVRSGEAREVIAAVALQQESPLIQLGRDFDYVYRPPTEHWPNATLRSAPVARFDFVQITANDPLPDSCKKNQACQRFQNLYTNLLGEHQAANASVAIAGLLQLVEQGWQIEEQAIRAGLSQVSWPARVEVVSQQPVVIIDGAHNEASIAALLQTVREYFGPRRLLVLFATGRDKDVPGMLRLLAPACDLLFATEVPGNPRAMPANELARLAEQFGLASDKVLVDPDPLAAWHAVFKSALPEDIVCVTGSFFLAGRLRPVIIDELRSSSAGAQI